MRYTKQEWPYINAALEAAARGLLANFSIEEAWRVGVRLDVRKAPTLQSPSSAAVAVVRGVVQRSDQLVWDDGQNLTWIMRLIVDHPEYFRAIAIHTDQEHEVSTRHAVPQRSNRRSHKSRVCQSYAAELAFERCLRANSETGFLWHGEAIATALVGKRNSNEIDASMWLRRILETWSVWRVAEFEIAKTGWSPRLTAAEPAVLGYTFSDQVEVRINPAFAKAWCSVLNSAI